MRSLPLVSTGCAAPEGCEEDHALPLGDTLDPPRVHLLPSISHVHRRVCETVFSPPGLEVGALAALGLQGRANLSPRRLSDFPQNPQLGKNRDGPRKQVPTARSGPFPSPQQTAALKTNRCIKNGPILCGRSWQVMWMGQIPPPPLLGWP